MSDASETLARGVAFDVIAEHFNGKLTSEEIDAIRETIGRSMARRAPPSRVLQDEGVVAWRDAIDRVRSQLGQAGGTGTAGVQNSITEREVGGWVLDAVEDELAALYAAPPAILPSTIGGSVGVSEEMMKAAVREFRRNEAIGLEARLRNAIVAALAALEPKP